MIYGVVELLYDASTFSLSKIVKFESEFHLDCSAIIWIFVFGRLIEPVHDMNPQQDRTAPH